MLVDRDRIDANDRAEAKSIVQLLSQFRFRGRYSG